MAAAAIDDNSTAWLRQVHAPVISKLGRGRLMLIDDGVSELKRKTPRLLSGGYR
jgi:hypothetical protein